MARRPWNILMAIAPAILIAASPVQNGPADRPAPLPDGLVASGKPGVAGLYAESRYGDVTVNRELELLEIACKDRGIMAKVEGRALQWSGKRQLYRSHGDIAVFDSTPTIATDPSACTARLSLRHSVRRMPATRDNLLATGWTDALPACKPRSISPRCEDRVVAGLQAKCVHLGDSFVGTTNCYSTRADLSHGLRLASSDYSDDGSLPENA
jgi:hypothetical protein